MQRQGSFIYSQYDANFGGKTLQIRENTTKNLKPKCLQVAPTMKTQKKKVMNTPDTARILAHFQNNLWTVHFNNVMGFRGN